MGRPRKKRRQAHGSAWHWKQTDAWYFTLPGTKKRTPLFDEQGERIRGQENRERAEQALAKIRLAGGTSATEQSPVAKEWMVAQVCSEYIQSCERRMAAGSMSRSHRNSAVAYLNDLCSYCGKMRVTQLKKSHIQAWLESHAGWRSPATHCSVLAVVLAAFNYADQMFDIPNPLKGLKRPKSQPRLQSFSPEEEKAILGATDECFGSFLVAAIRTGLRPFCELAKITADHVEVSARGMMWRVYSSKTKKTRKIPIPKEVAVLVRRLMVTAPQGSGQPLFRNSQGNRWTGTAGVMRFLAIKKKLGWDQDPVKGKYSCYTCRHTFAHRMLSGYWNGGTGCSIETLAELMGDTPKVCFDHYGREWGQNYQEPLWAAIGLGLKTPNRAASTSRRHKRA